MGGTGGLPRGVSVSRKGTKGQGSPKGLPLVFLGAAEGSGDSSHPKFCGKAICFNVRFRRRPLPSGTTENLSIPAIPHIVALHLMRGLALLCSSSAKTSQAPCQTRGDGAF